mmetsp:Transcript_5870/g.13925  ORF Transcript_5870/g.13925 Transcript_5870/m.13925 type:complete len:345 (-) Transcript_5870:1826-2860(-)
MADLTEHEILNVWPIHSKVNDVTLNIHTTASSTTLHLLGNQWGQLFTHITTENTRTERHVDSISKSRIRKDNGQTTLLGKHLHLSAVARESNLVGVDGNTTTETTDQSMVDVNLFTRLLHVSDDSFDFVEVQSLSSRGQDVLVMRSGGIFVDHGFVNETRLGIFLSLCSIFTTGTSSSNLSHLRLLFCQLDEIRSVGGEFSHLVTLEASQDILKHVESTVSVQLESNSWQQFVRLELFNDVAKFFANILLGFQRWWFLSSAKLFVQIRVRLRDGSQSLLQSGLVFLGLIQSNALAFVNVLCKEVIWVIQILKNSAREHGLESLPESHHIRGSHGQGGNQFRLVL